MQEISVNGENYVKASILASNFGYTSDYIGQLCRSRAVKATLVGRSWYVNEDSLREHRQGRYRGTSAKSKEHLRQAIEERLAKKTTPAQTSIKTRYESDERELFPSVAKSDPISKEIRLEQEKPEIEPKIIETSLIEEKIDEKTTNSAYISPIPVRRSPTPVFRTIPSSSFAKKSLVKEHNNSVAPFKDDYRHIKQPKKSYALVSALLCGFVMVEAALLFGVLGLEKRLVLTDNNQAMVLYGYNMNDALASLDHFIGR